MVNESKINEELSHPLLVAKPMQIQGINKNKN